LFEKDTAILQFVKNDNRIGWFMSIKAIMAPKDKQ
jgi:hypothetical protein